jgi:hypothetical protein
MVGFSPGGFLLFVTDLIVATSANWTLHGGMGSGFSDDFSTKMLTYPSSCMAVGFGGRGADYVQLAGPGVGNRVVVSSALSKHHRLLLSCWSAYFLTKAVA